MTDSPAYIMAMGMYFKFFMWVTLLTPLLVLTQPKGEDGIFQKMLVNRTPERRHAMR
jgi:hypothetical protein